MKAKAHEVSAENNLVDPPGMSLTLICRILNISCFHCRLLMCLRQCCTLCKTQSSKARHKATNAKGSAMQYDKQPRQDVAKHGQTKQDAKQPMQSHDLVEAPLGFLEPGHARACVVHFRVSALALGLCTKLGVVLLYSVRMFRNTELGRCSAWPRVCYLHCARPTQFTLLE